jgi:hypothetical protein
MKRSWQVSMQQRAQEYEGFFALSQNIFRAPIAAEAWRFGATRTRAYATHAARKLADPKRSCPV